jgi:hypothetical protein
MRAASPYVVSADVIRRLRQWLPREAITRYDNWMTDRTAELPPWRVGKHFALVPAATARERRARRSALLQALQQRLPGLFAWFANELAGSRAKPDAARRAVAYDRVLDPFLDADQMKGVELSWEELARSRTKEAGVTSKGSKLWKILEHGMKRELLLLDRPADQVRCKQFAKAEFDKEMTLKALELYLLETVGGRHG